MQEPLTKLCRLLEKPASLRRRTVHSGNDCWETKPHLVVPSSLTAERWASCHYYLALWPCNSLNGWVSSGLSWSLQTPTHVEMRKVADKVKVRAFLLTQKSCWDGQRLSRFGRFIVSSDLFMHTEAVTTVHLGSEMTFTHTQELIVGKRGALLWAFCWVLSSSPLTYTHTQTLTVSLRLCSQRIDCRFSVFSVECC